MIAKDFINYMIPPLRLTDSISKAHQCMEELRLEEIPVVDEGKFIGLLNDEVVYNDSLERDALINQQQLYGASSVVEAYRHYYDVLKTAYSSGTRLVAVTDQEGNYEGVISVDDLVDAFANMSAANVPGAILVLGLEFRDYSLASISRIVESDELKILSAHVMNDPEEPGSIKLTLKLNQEEISHVKGLLSAKGYKILHTYNDKLVKEHEQDRFEMLMKYLNI